MKNYILKNYYSDEIEQIILNEAIMYHFGKHSSLREIDYKFWEDVGTKELAYSLAEQLADAKNEIKELKEAYDNLNQNG